MDYRADRDRTCAPGNSHSRPAQTVTGEWTGEGAALPQFTFAASLLFGVQFWGIISNSHIVNRSRDI